MEWMGKWQDGVGGWGDFDICCELEEVVLARICELMGRLKIMVPLRDSEDVAVWLSELCGGYSTKFGYEVMMEGFVGLVLLMV